VILVFLLSDCVLSRKLDVLLFEPVIINFKSVQFFIKIGEFFVGLSESVVGFDELCLE
jgi:hypothetical protein